MWRVQFREITRGVVGRVLVAWALVVACAAFLVEARFTSFHTFINIAGIATLLAGAALGWQGRRDLAYKAPFLSVLLAWPAVFVGCCVHFGFLNGAVYGVRSIVIFLLVGPVEIGFLLLGSILGQEGLKIRDAEVKIRPPQR
jgi:predicted Na+-dependent transporter